MISWWLSLLPCRLIGCIPESRVFDLEDGSRVCELSCRCDKVESRVVFPPITGGYPKIK